MHIILYIIVRTYICSLFCSFLLLLIMLFHNFFFKSYLCLFDGSFIPCIIQNKAFGLDTGTNNIYVKVNKEQSKMSIPDLMVCLCYDVLASVFQSFQGKSSNLLWRSYKPILILGAKKWSVNDSNANLSGWWIMSPTIVQGSVCWTRDNNLRANNQINWTPGFPFIYYLIYTKPPTEILFYYVNQHILA